MPIAAKTIGRSAARVSWSAAERRRTARLWQLASAIWRLPARLPWERLGGRRAPGAEVWLVVRALAIAAPLLLVFGALFFAADAVFAQRIDDLFSWDLTTFNHHARVLAFDPGLGALGTIGDRRLCDGISLGPALERQLDIGRHRGALHERSGLDRRAGLTKQGRSS